MLQRLTHILWRKSFVVALLVFIFVPSVLFAFTVPGVPSGYVNDFAGVLTGEQKIMLENKLHAFNASTTNEIAVVTVRSLQGDYIEHYAVELFKAWGIGTKKNDNGVLLLIAVDDHQMRIEVGYGLEGALTDTVAAQIIRDDLTPAFKQNDFYGGINKATDDIVQVTQGEYVVDAKAANNGIQISFETLIFVLVIAVQFFGSILSRSKSWWAGGVVGGVAGAALTFFGVLGLTFGIGVVVTVMLALLGLLFDYFVSSRYSQSVSSGTSIPWWVGGNSFGGGRSSGSSFGGFGGGRSGGGGASGSW